VKNFKGRDHLEEVGIDGNLSEWILEETGWEGVEWLYLAQERNQW
jgi:hypothetical protein